MSILVGPDTRVLVQGITGAAGAFHTEKMGPPDLFLLPMPPSPVRAITS